MNPIVDFERRRGFGRATAPFGVRGEHDRTSEHRTEAGRRGARRRTPSRGHEGPFAFLSCRASPAGLPATRPAPLADALAAVSAPAAHSGFFSQNFLASRTGPGVSSPGGWVSRNAVAASEAALRTDVAAAREPGRPLPKPTRAGMSNRTTFLFAGRSVAVRRGRCADGPMSLTIRGISSAAATVSGTTTFARPSPGFPEANA